MTIVNTNTALNIAHPTTINPASSPISISFSFFELVEFWLFGYKGK